MSAVTVAAAAVGGLLAYVAGRRSKANELDRQPPATTSPATFWREGKEYGKAEGYDKGYADGWTSGRLALVEEQQARRMHPTGSPLSELKAIDAEADDRMRGLD